jgi:tryptophanyl-tRNA synthetase
LVIEGKKRRRVVSGMRPTGRLHIGHYFGALENWVRLQGDPDFECFYFIADWHALTSDYADTSGVAQNTIEIMTDYLAAGLDPSKSVIFQQSLVPEHAELHLLLSMVTPLSWLERVPTYKEALEQVKDKDLHNYGFLGYPCLQTADIVIYSSPGEAGKEGAQLFVPVGEDQVSHVELSREIVRKCNLHWGVQIDTDAMELAISENRLPLSVIFEGADRELSVVHLLETGQRLNREDLKILEARIKRRISEIGIENWNLKILRLEGSSSSVPGIKKNVPEYVRLEKVLTEPGVMLTKTPRIPGLDGRKMSKSYGNAITLSETDEEIRKKTKVMVTDPARKRRTDPGNPDVCPVYDWHKLFSTPETLAWAAEGCRTAGIGCIECKAKMADHLIAWIVPKREARNKWEKDPKGVLEIIEDGSRRARVEAKKTMERVREAVFGWEKKRREVLVTEKK